MKSFEITVAEHTKYEIQLVALVCGGDLSVTICGGSHHVGATVLACGILPDGSRPRYTATVSTLSVPDHKDSLLAGELAAGLADELACQVSLTVGIHIDDATKEEISILCENSKEACNRLSARVWRELNEYQNHIH